LIIRQKFWKSIQNNIINLGLYENSTGVLLGPKISSISGDGTGLFSGLSKPLNGEETFLLKGDISADAYGNATHIFKIFSNFVNGWALT